MDMSEQRQTVYTSAQVRELDRIAIEDFGVSGYELMTRAGQATFDLIKVNWSQVHEVCVFCGAGNNAGDGYVVARLALQAGWQVMVWALVPAERLQGDAAQACQDFVQAGGVVQPFQPGAVPIRQCSQSGDANSGAARVPERVFVDALLGTGLQRDVSGAFAAAVNWLNQQPAPVVAVDVPSGLDADTGQVRGCAVRATATITYIGMKQGLLTGLARDYTGNLYFDDLRVDAAVYARLKTDDSCWLLGQEVVQQALPPRARCSHKGHWGHSLLVGGAQGMSGAIRLSGAAALRSGSGLVTVATHTAHADWLNQGQPELMVAALESARDLRVLLSRKSALGIGPGLSQGQWAQQLLLLALEADMPLVLDADALNLLAGWSRQQDNWVLTPHPAEAARLLGWETAEVEQNRVAAVRLIQQKFGGVCVLKGAGTLIANADEVAFCAAGNPGMASGGMGDVLTGIITALLAQGLELFQAAYTGVQVHALAADRAAEQGERGLLASDVIAQIRNVVNP